MTLDPKVALYPHGSKAAIAVTAVSVFSILAALVTLGVVIYAANSAPKSVWVLYVAAACWAIGAPLWAWFEYFYLYRRFGRPDTFDLFKQGQQVALAIWAGVTLSLAAFASSDMFKAAKDPIQCNCQCKAPGA